MILATLTHILTWAGLLGGLALCLVLSVFTNGMETALYVMNKVRLELRAEQGWRPAMLLQRMIGRWDNLIAALLIGTNIVNYGATFLVTSMFVLLGMGEHAEWYTLAVATPLLFLVGESVPKNVFRRRADQLVYRLVWPLRVLVLAVNAIGIAPLVQGFLRLLMLLAGRRKLAPIGHEGLAALVSEGHASGVLTHMQSVMAERVMNIKAVHLRDVMIPLSEAVGLPAGANRDRLLATIGKHNYSRLPLLREGQVVGVLNVYRVLAAEGDTLPVDATVAPLVLPASLGVPEGLYRMQRAHASMAVVADGGRHVGIVTIKDIVEEIVGEIAEW